MERYKNRNGNSNIAAYEIGVNFIKVKFNDGAVYLYNYASTGAANIAHMIRLAREGSGLNSFISRVVRKNYYLKY